MKKKVLLVDPDDVCRRIVAQRLMIAGYDVLNAHDGKTALTYAIEKKPDAIISELDMPQLNGRQLCRQIRQTAETAHIPIIILTANRMLQNKLSAFKEGADDYMTKPFSLAELEARLTAALRKNASL